MNKIAVFDLDGVLFDPTIRKVVYTAVHAIAPERADECYEKGHYCQYDTVIEGAVECVHSFHERGYSISYLSGRRFSAAEATARIISESGFPDGFLNLKPRKDDSTVEFKHEVLESYSSEYDEVLFVDDTESNRAVGEALNIPTYKSCDDLMLEIAK